MKTQIAILVLGTGFLVPLYLLISTCQRRFFLVAIFSAIISQVLISQILNLADLRRGASFVHVMRGFNRSPKDHAAPVLLLLGSSYTARNIDGQSLEFKLALLGLNSNVRQMSYPGSFAYEQDYYLDRYLIEFPVPDIVVIEIGTEHGFAIKPINYLINQTIEYHDFERFKVVGNNIFNKYSATAANLSDVKSLINHTLARAFHLGILHSLESRFIGPVKSGFAPEKLGKDQPTQDIIEKGLFEKLLLQPASDYRVEFRRRQAQKLLKFGVKHVIYWQPPSADVEQRMRSGTLCKAFPSDCIEFDQPELLNGPFWTDKNHLDVKGASLLTDWLAARLARRKEFNDVFR